MYLAVPQAVTAEVHDRAQISPCVICGGGRWYWDRVFSETLCSTVSITFHFSLHVSCVIWGMANGPASGSVSQKHSYIFASVITTI